MSTIRHGDYQGEVVFEDGKLVIRILHIDDLITTEVDNASEVQAAFADLVEDYLASCAEIGREPDKPFKGLFNVRIPPYLHRQVAFAAANESVTLNAYVMTALEQKVAAERDASYVPKDTQFSTWTGSLSLSLVTCPVQLHRASIGKNEVELDQEFVIEIEQFVSRSEVDTVYLSDSHFLTPNGSIGQDAYAVIREVMRATDKAALATVRTAESEHSILLDVRETGMLATMLRTADQVRDAAVLFQSIQEVKITKDMIELGKHIVLAKSALFDVDKLKRKVKKRKKVADQPEMNLPRYGGNVIDLMDALRRSMKSSDDETSAGRQAAPRRIEPS